MGRKASETIETRTGASWSAPFGSDKNWLQADIPRDGGKLAGFATTGKSEAISCASEMLKCTRLASCGDMWHCVAPYD